MHFPLEISFGQYKISSHLLFESIAFIFGFRYYLYQRSKIIDRISDSNRQWLLIATIFGAFIFSRLIGSFEHPSDFFNASNKLLYFYSSKTIVGGLLGGLLFVEIFKYYLNEKSSSGDLITFPLIFAMIIGRIGCFTSGVYEDTYGVTTNSFTGLNLGDGLLRHPVALYEIVFLLILSILIIQIEKRYILKDGLKFQIFMISYFLFRLFLDFIKPRSILFFSLSTIQISSIIGLLYYYKTVFNLVFHKNKIIDGKKLHIL